ncbi:MAG: hypothetical protein IT376_20270 [Polyangiaceae bacterium]|nr:hypothetical protein [Polyangiaceae bacterium]
MSSARRPPPEASRAGALALLACLATGCSRGGGSGTAPPDPVPPNTGSSASAAPSARRPSTAARSGDALAIPEGALLVGSAPGDPGRDPTLEPRLQSVSLGAFRIDRLPYPNDPEKPPRTGVTREEAAELCAERGARLCTELEWERSCKGPENQDYAGAAAWDPRCAVTPGECASGFDVVALGCALREWTASSRGPGDAARAVARGAPTRAAAEAHRCAARSPLAPDTKADDLGFRCCHGAPNAAVVAEPALGRVFSKVRVTAERLEKLLAESPETAELAKDVKLFRDPEAATTVVARGPGDRQGFDFTVAPLSWSPVPGAEYLLVAARSGESTSFVVAYWALGDDRYRLAASFVMKNEPGPVALAYSESIRPRLHFSTCWGCPGETGKILHRPPDRVAIVQP